MMVIKIITTINIMFLFQKFNKKIQLLRKNILQPGSVCSSLAEHICFHTVSAHTFAHFISFLFVILLYALLMAECNEKNNPFLSILLCGENDSLPLQLKARKALLGGSPVWQISTDSLPQINIFFSPTFILPSYHLIIVIDHSQTATSKLHQSSSKSWCNANKPEEPRQII